MSRLNDINFVEIQTISELPILRRLALEIWPNVYREILSEEQIDYMLDLMYSESALENDFKRGVQFYLLQNDNKNIGYLAFELNKNEVGNLYLHKIYIDPNYRKSGVGKQSIQFLKDKAEENQQNKISLNVNRYNSAKEFYQKMGFLVVREEDIDIGNNFWMNDYVMEFLFS